MKLTILGNVPSQKNGKQFALNRTTGKMFIISNKRVQDWQKSAHTQLSAQFSGLQVTDYPISITAIFWRDTKRAYDLDNAYSTVADALVKAGVITDDNINFIECVTLQHGGIDRENPRAEVYIDE